MGEKSDESVCQPPDAGGVSCRDDRHEHLQGDVRVGGDGNLCLVILWLQRIGHGPLAASVRLQSCNHWLGDRGLNDVVDHAVRSGGGNFGLEHGLSLSADLLRLLPP